MFSVFAGKFDAAKRKALGGVVCGVDRALTSGRPFIMDPLQASADEAAFEDFLNSSKTTPPRSGSSDPDARLDFDVTPHPTAEINTSGDSLDLDSIAKMMSDAKDALGNLTKSISETKKVVEKQDPEGGAGIPCEAEGATADEQERNVEGQGSDESQEAKARTDGAKVGAEEAKTGTEEAIKTETEVGDAGKPVETKAASPSDLIEAPPLGPFDEDDDDDVFMRTLDFKPEPSVAEPDSEQAISGPARSVPPSALPASSPAAPIPQARTQLHASAPARSVDTLVLPPLPAPTGSAALSDSDRGAGGPGGGSNPALPALPSFQLSPDVSLSFSSLRDALPSVPGGDVTLRRSQQRLRTRDPSPRRPSPARRSSPARVAAPRRGPDVREWELKISDRDRQIFVLRTQLRKLRDEQAATPRALLAANKTSFRALIASGVDLKAGVDVGARELEALQKEVRGMEAIITGLNTENARLLAANRKRRKGEADFESRVEVKAGGLRKENEQLKQELRAMRGADERRAQAIAGVRIAELEKKLQNASTARERERIELRCQVDKLRAAKRALEVEAAGAAAPGALASAHEHIDQLNKQLAAAEASKDEEIDKLTRKLRWYIENQAHIDDLQENARRDRETIATLRERATAVREAKAATGTRSKSERKQQARIKELEGIVADLQETLKTKQPESITALIHAAAPTREEGELIATLKEQNKELKARLSDAERAKEAKVRTLKQMHDQTKSLYEDRIKALQKRRSSGPRTASGKASARAKELEKKLSDLRAYYKKKSGVIEARATASEAREAELKRQVGNLKRKLKNSASSAEQRSAVDEIASLRKRVQDQDKVIASLRQAGGADGSAPAAEDSANAALSAATAKARAAEAQFLAKSELLEKAAAARKGEQEGLAYREVGSRLEAAYASQLQVAKASHETVVKQLREQLDRQQSSSDLLITSVRAKLEAAERSAAVAQRDKAAAEKKAIELQYELNAVRDTPAAARFEALQCRVREIDAATRKRENKLRTRANHAEASLADAQRRLHAKYQALLKRKDARVRHFRTELDSLTAALRSLQADAPPQRVDDAPLPVARRNVRKKRALGEVSVNKPRDMPLVKPGRRSVVDDDEAIQMILSGAMNELPDEEE